MIGIFRQGELFELNVSSNFRVEFKSQYFLENLASSQKS